MTTLRTRHDAGFTVIEMLISVAIMMMITGATFTLMNPAQGMYSAQPQVMDMQQRLRLGVDTLAKDLMMAGGGTYQGSNTGSLVNYFAPIVPYRIGNITPDPAGSFFTDRLTLMYVPATAAQTSIRDDMPKASAEVKVNAQPGCPKNDNLCGFHQGMMVLIFDSTGAYETFQVTEVQDPALHLQHRGQDFQKAYSAGSSISQVAAYTYWLKLDDVAGNYQLMKYDGYQSDMPIIDNVVGLSFEYYGDPNPAYLRPGMLPATTYGPAPPALGVDNDADLWGAGENCAFQVVGGLQVPRMASLGSANGRLVKLTQEQLTDGPWCPDQNFSAKYDVDLFRIRRVRVSLRVQVADASLRGGVGSEAGLFTKFGTSKGGERFVPDQEIKFDIAPRNMNLGR
jgi:pilin/secretion family protein with methylation motif